MYRAEVWRWKERKELEKVQKEYIKWFLNLYSCTSDYIMHKETDVNRVRLAAGCRVISFEENTIKDRERKLVDLYKRKRERRIQQNRKRG